MPKKKDIHTAKDNLRIVSLFSGCGGLDLGFTGGFSFYETRFDKLPIDIVFANDFDVDASTCYNSNSLLVKDGTKCLLKDIREIGSDDIPDYDILLAGFPCQPFSNAGNRKGVNDDNGRGTLFEECERIIRAKVESGKAPIGFVFENVRGILSGKIHRKKTGTSYTALKGSPAALSPWKTSSAPTPNPPTARPSTSTSQK